ncbi:peptidylprolyl isomerase [archaeon]|nr:peptidylprolyl isomerase [archaeon]MBT7128777.1 peptidylprolyl isomerase [archaeon]
MVVEKGSKIKVEYRGSFEDGEVFDASEKHGQPLEFEAGAGMVVPGFDAAVIGMDVGEEKTFTLKPEEAYGMPDERAVQKVPRDKFPTEAKEGMMIGVPLPNGQQIPAKITKIDEKEATIDMNHPMAGKTLVFWIKIVEVL